MARVIRAPEDDSSGTGPSSRSWIESTPWLTRGLADTGAKFSAPCLAIFLRCWVKMHVGKLFQRGTDIAEPEDEGNNEYRMLCVAKRVKYFHPHAERGEL
jgi:hypothetical protein